MSQATKRKHVVQEAMGDFINPTGNQQIVKVIGSRGNNLHEVVTSKGESFLVSMPNKFRKNLWIKRGDYVIVDPIDEGEKVKAEICVILYKDHIRHLQRLQLWPDGFTEQPAAAEKTDSLPGRTAGDGQEEEEEGDEGKGSSDSEDDESDLFVNTNRPDTHYSESEEEEGESGEEEQPNAGP